MKIGEESGKSEWYDLLGLLGAASGVQVVAAAMAIRRGLAESSAESSAVSSIGYNQQAADFL